MMKRGRFPNSRMRRMRSKEFIRSLVRENSLTSQDLIYPVFIQDGTQCRQAVDSMPGALRGTPLAPHRLKAELRSRETVFLDLETLIRQRDAYWRLFG